MSGAPSVQDLLARAEAGGDAWRAAVAALDADGRRTLLAAADRALAADAEALPCAAAVYAALEDAIDPATPEGTARVRALLARPDDRPPPVPRLFARAAAVATDPDVRDLATVQAVRVRAGPADAAGEDDARLHAVLARVGGSGTATERVLTKTLAMRSLQAYRETEGLVLARRSLVVAERTGPPAAAVAALLLVTAALEALEDADALADAADDLERRVRALPAEAAAYPRLVVARRRVAAALGRGRHAEAEAALAEAERLARAPELAGSPVAQLLPFDRAEVLLAVGRPAEAIDAADAVRARWPGGPDAALDLMLRCASARAAFAARRHDGAAQVADLLDRLEAARAHRAGLVRTLAVATARDLASLDPADERVARAYELAAAASVERALEIQAFLAAESSAVRPTPEDLETLRRAQERAVTRDRRLVQAIAHRFGPADDGDLARGARTVVCAWCQRVRSRSALWVPLHAVTPIAPDGGWRVTHGICPECAPRATAR